MEALARLKPFFPDAKMPVVLLGEEGVSTQDGASSAAIAVNATLTRAAYRLESLSLAAGFATSWNDTGYPQPLKWRGDGIYGLLMGVRT